MRTETLFYGGCCGLCHRAVKFVLKRDREGKAFRFAPLEGETFRARISAGRRAGLSDSVIVRTRDGSLLMRSAACIHILRRLGERWKVIADLLTPIPEPLRDAVYDFVARVRYRVFRRRDNMCPTVSSELRARFDP